MDGWIGTAIQYRTGWEAGVASPNFSQILSRRDSSIDRRWGVVTRKRR